MINILKEFPFFICLMTVRQGMFENAMPLYGMNWFEFQVIFLRIGHLVSVFLTKLLLYKQSFHSWMRYEYICMSLEQKVPKILYYLVYCICLSINGRLV